jgi:hypothetical protein
LRPLRSGWSELERASKVDAGAALHLDGDRRRRGRQAKGSSGWTGRWDRNHGGASLAELGERGGSSTPGRHRSQQCRAARAVPGVQVERHLLERPRWPSCRLGQAGSQQDLRRRGPIADRGEAATSAAARLGEQPRHLRNEPAPFLAQDLPGRADLHRPWRVELLLVPARDCGRRRDLDVVLPELDGDGGWGGLRLEFVGVLVLGRQPYLAGDEAGLGPDHAPDDDRRSLPYVDP